MDPNPVTTEAILNTLLDKEWKNVTDDEFCFSDIGQEMGSSWNCVVEGWRPDPLTQSASMLG